jgi:hydrogenase maturation protein HypF
MKMAERGINSPQTSSMGRLFDAYSALLGVCEQVEYEGQAAIELEQLIAWDHTPVEPWPLRLAEDEGCLVIDHRPWLEALLADVSDRGRSAAQVSRTFHESVVNAVVEICLRISTTSGVRDVVLSGGVFLNQHLLVRTEQELTHAGLRVYTHSRIPANDGGLSVGQVMVAAARAVSARNELPGGHLRHV